MIKKIKKIILFFLFSTILISCDEMSGPTGRVEEVNNPIKIIENEEKSIEVKFRDTYKQFRNNKKKLLTNDLKGIDFDDETFNSFKGANMEIKDYEEWFLENATTKGINKEYLKRAFNKLNLIIDKDIIKHPVIIDTVIFKEKDCFAIGYQWDYKKNNEEYSKIFNLPNKMIIVMEQETSEILSMLKLN